MANATNKFTLGKLWVFCILVFSSCENSNYKLSKVEGKRIEVNSKLESDKAIDDFISPFRESINKSLDEVISYSPNTLSKKDGELNTAIGNLMADAVYEEVNPIFKKRSRKTIDFVLLNHGGIRSIISKGNVTIRTAFEVMPFENAVVVVALDGEQIHKMLTYLSRAKKAHPVSKQLQITLEKDYSLKFANLNGEPITTDKVYYVATNDYLYNGGDSMAFFHPNDSLYTLDYKIRNVLIDHFKKYDTLSPKKDNRFVRLPN